MSKKTLKFGGCSTIHLLFIYFAIKTPYDAESIAKVVKTKVIDIQKNINVNSIYLFIYYYYLHLHINTNNF